MPSGSLTTGAPTTSSGWVVTPASGKLRLALVGGTGSVDVEEEMPDGTALKVETAVTIPYSKVYDSVPNVRVRFTPTAVTSDIKWQISAGGA